MMTDAALPPFCEVHGCRGRWDADQSHTLCGKATTSAATPLEQADALLGDAIALVILAASTDKDPRFRALLVDQRDMLRAVRSTLGVINVY